MKTREEIHLVKRMDPRARVSAGLWLLVVAGGLLGACGKSSGPNKNEDKNPPIVGQDCSGETCPNKAEPPNWSGGTPTFVAHFQVVDPSGAPVVGATVRTDKIMWGTDATGFARIGPIPAGKPQPLTVEKAGWTPRFAQTDVFESGQQLAHVVLTPVGVRETIALGERILLGHQGAVVDLPPKALIGKDGTRPSSGKAEMTQLSPDKVAPASMPASRKAWTEAGTPTVMEELLSATYLRFTDDAGAELHLAPGQTAMLELPIPAGAAVSLGEAIAMWTLDEKDNSWHQEKTCTVEERQIGGQTELVCRGVVSHFSLWAIAKEYDIYRPNALGCINANVKEEADACYTTVVEREVMLSCDAAGANCKPVGSPNHGFYLPEKATQVSYCSVVTPGTYRVELTYRVDASKCIGTDAPLSGRRVMVSPPLGLKSFSDMLGQTLMLNFTLNGTRDCPTLCAQVDFQVDKAALAAPAWTDADGDGAWVTANKDTKPPLGTTVDCDDTSRLVHPNAPEPFCATKDMNCDGIAPKAVKALSEVQPYRWNYECSSCLAIEAFKSLSTDEMDGNEYDENCDGRVGDRDLDTFSVPQDCNDRNSGVAPNKDEIPGNLADENCDGMALDADNDGFPSRVHSYAVSEIGAKFPQFTPDKFVDCDDYDRRTNPSVPVSQEVGQLAQFYYTANAGVHRHVGYCSMFNQDGTPSDYFFRVVKDRNCDGKLTDMDGDGFTHPNDQTLGQDKAVDCDELDPRVGAGQWDPNQQRVLICQTDPAKLINDSICTVKVQPYEAGVSCPVLSLNGTTLKTYCEEIRNSDGSATGEGVCAFPGWSDANPLSIHPGEFFGPCDGDPGQGTKLPCNEGLTCGGPAEGASPWTSQFETYIRDTYLNGEEIRFKGMCFPACKIQ
jgi:hypothetical protein